MITRDGILIEVRRRAITRTKEIDDMDLVMQKAVNYRTQVRSRLMWPVHDVSMHVVELLNAAVDNDPDE